MESKIFDQCLETTFKKLPDIPQHKILSVINSRRTPKSSLQRTSRRTPTEYEKLLITQDETEIRNLNNKLKISKTHANRPQLGTHVLTREDARKLIDNNKLITEHAIGLIAKTYPKLVINQPLPAMKQECTNIVYANSEVIKIATAVFDENIKWCLSEEDIDPEHPEYNPFTGLNFDHTPPVILKNNGSPNSESKELMCTFTPKSVDFKHYWVYNVFTFGKVFVKVPYDILADFAKTKPQSSVTVYRGLSFANPVDCISFLNSCFKEKEITVDINTFNLASENCIYEDKKMFDKIFKQRHSWTAQTFNSWTYSLTVAVLFSRLHGEFGCVLECELKPRDIIVDINKYCQLSNDSQSEEELVAAPNKYKIVINLIRFGAITQKNIYSKNKELKELTQF